MLLRFPCIVRSNYFFILFSMTNWCYIWKILCLQNTFKKWLCRLLFSVKNFPKIWSSKSKFTFFKPCGVLRLANCVDLDVPSFFNVYANVLHNWLRSCIWKVTGGKEWLAACTRNWDFWKNQHSLWLLIPWKCYTAVWLYKKQRLFWFPLNQSTDTLKLNLGGHCHEHSWSLSR